MAGTQSKALAPQQALALQLASQEVLWEAWLDPDSGQDITCLTAPHEEYVLQFLDTGIKLRSSRQRTVEAAVFITRFGCFAMVIFCMICYNQDN